MHYMKIAFELSLAEAPFDTALRRAYADWLEQQSNPEAAMQRALADRIDTPFDALQTESLQHCLYEANARRPSRTLSWDSIVRLARRALVSESGWRAIGGASAPRSWGRYVPRTIALAARKKEGTVRVAIGVGNAHHGNSITLPLCGLRANAPSEQFSAWAEGGDL